MSLHSYSKLWTHLVWNTRNKQKVLPSKSVRKQLSEFLYNYSKEKGIYMKINYVNQEHVHALIDLPTNYTMEQVVKLFKGSSSHWINQNRIIPQKFYWGRGYGAFSVSESSVEKVAAYITNQEEHHKKLTFLEEYRNFMEKHKIKYCG
ncbi:MAG: transposase [Flavobacteriales bacterium]|nr:MAG: transposase [Flavobacteriales bacterium]